MAPKALCVVMDDFGLHEGINRAGLELARQGRIQAISCMVGGPVWRNGSAALRAWPQTSADIGLHLDFTECPLLADSRRGLGEWIVRSHLRLAGRRALTRELRAQWDAFEQALGRTPDFVDGHQHVHQFPQVRDALLDELARRGAAPWLRNTRCPSRRSAASRKADAPGFKARFIAALGSNALARRAHQQGLGMNQHLLGVYDFQGDASGFARRVQGWLAMARHGDLLMCHPAQSAPASDPIGVARRAEYEVLAGRSFPGWLQPLGLRLQRMSQILRDTQLIG